MRRAGPLEPAAFLLSLLWLAPAAAAPAVPGTPQLLSDLDRDTEHRAALAGPIDKAKQALARARAMDQAGDVRHGAALRAVAREWVDCARDVVRTSQTEARAEKAEKTLDDLETKRARGRALLEETIARRGRAQALLDQLERESRLPAPSDADADANANAKKAKSSAKKPARVNE